MTERTTRDRLVESGLFKTQSGQRTLYIEQEQDTHADNPEAPRLIGLRAEVDFDAFGEPTTMRLFTFDPVMREIVAQNRRALGLPPQES